MQTNTKLIIAGVLFVILIYVFGRNPLDEGRRKAAEQRAAAGDPLIQAIEEHNKKNPRGGVVVSPPTAYPATGNGQYPVRQVLPNPTYSNPVYPSYMLKKGVAPNPAEPAAPPASQGKDSYYPPAPSGMDGQNPLPPQSSLDFRLGDGSRIAFSGPYVYTYDPSGRRIHMPDGDYRTNGGLELTVRNGKRIIATNN